MLSNSEISGTNYKGATNKPPLCVLSNLKLTLEMSQAFQRSRCPFIFNSNYHTVHKNKEGKLCLQHI